MSTRRPKPTTKRKRRDYRAENRRRKALAKKRGLSPSQGRGHPKPGEKHVSGETRKSNRWDRIIERGVRHLRNGESLTEAARRAGVSTERLRHYVAETNVATRKGNRWVVHPDKRLRRIRMLTTEGPKTLEVSLKAASLIGSHEEDVGAFRESNDVRPHKQYEGKSIVDADGKRHFFEARPNVLYRLAHAGTESFDKIYAILR